MKHIRTFSAAGLLICLAVFACQPPDGGKRKADEGPAVADQTATERHVAPYFVKVTAAAFSPDNKYVLTGFNGGKKLLTLWEVATGKEVHSFPGHRDMVTGLAFVSGGKQVLSGSRDGRLLQHDVATGRLLNAVQAYDGNVVNLAASPDGMLALTAGVDNDGTFGKLWAPKGLKLVRTFGQPGFQAWRMAVSADKKWALAGCLGATRPSGFVRLWDLTTGRATYSLPGSEGWWAGVAAFSPDSNLAVIAKLSENIAHPRVTQRLALWEVRTGKILRLLEGAGAPVVFTADGKQVVGLALAGKPEVAGEGWKVRVSWWDVKTGRAFKSAQFAQPGEDYPTLFLSPDARLALIAVGGVWQGPFGKERPRLAEQTLAVWELAANRLVRRWTSPLADPDP
jgi:WD40 repeat protein